MRILLLNQCFHPDLAATAQYASDLGAHLASSGHEVHVLASAHAYASPGTRYRRYEFWQGVRIERLPALELGKSRAYARLASSASFWLACLARLVSLARYDLVIAMTSPPLIGALAAAFVAAKGGRLAHWVMDLNPDEAIAAGWLPPAGLITGGLERLLRYSLRKASSIVVLDDDMRQRILARGIEPRKVHVVPLWSRDTILFPSAARREQFRRQFGLHGRFVVMYAGNHSPCHPLDTLLEAARLLEGDPGVVFCFAGGGNGFPRVARYRDQHRLTNIVCLPYQPVDELGAMLAAADLHVVVLGERFAGIVHPSKIYNVIAVGSPVLFIGPDSAYISTFTGHSPIYTARHGESYYVAALIEEARRAQKRLAQQLCSRVHPFRPEVVLPRLCVALGVAGVQPSPLDQEASRCFLPAGATR